jgi:hypothetical protein
MWPESLISTAAGSKLYAMFVEAVYRETRWPTAGEMVATSSMMPSARPVVCRQKNEPLRAEIFSTFYWQLLAIKLEGSRAAEASSDP